LKQPSEAKCKKLLRNAFRDKGFLKAVAEYVEQQERDKGKK